jgi:hypothetical protein
LPFDLAQDREPVERLVEPFDIWNLNQAIKFQLRGCRWLKGSQSDQK